jgi:hypothetical protein
VFTNFLNFYFNTIYNYNHNKMVRRNQKRSKACRRGARWNNRVRISTQRSSPASSIIGYINLFRIITSTLSPEVKGLFDFVFNLVNNVLSGKTYNVGAFAMFGLSPANLLFNSPYLAKDSSGSYTFPGYPVSMKFIQLRIKNTTKTSEHSGRWAAVIIPYREEHDSKHYVTILKDLTFSETAAMPHAKTASADKDITLTFKMRDRTSYCARPREISEEIAVVYVIWDVSSRDNLNTKVTDSMFSCEIEMRGGCIPHTIFGPSHRVSYTSDTFAMRSITTGQTVREHYSDGRVVHRPLDQDFVMVQ